MAHESEITIHKVLYGVTVMSFSKNIFRVTEMVMLLLLLEINAIVNPHGPTVASDFIKCIAHLIEKNFDKPGLLIFGNTENITTPVVSVRTEILKKIHKSLKFSIEIAAPTNKVEICDENLKDGDTAIFKEQYKGITIADYFLIIIDNFQDFILLAGTIIRSRTWNPSGRFIIFLINFAYNETQNIENVENILSCLFKYNAIDVIVAVHKPGRIRHALLYSWKPYDPPRFCGYLNETARNRIILENTCENGVMRYDKVMFTNKLPENMMSCVLNILALKRQPFVGETENDPNIERKLVNRVFMFYNFTVNYKVLNEFRGERNNVGEWNGALRKLLAKEGTILLGGIFPDFDVHEDFECSASYLADSYAWVVPRADPSAPWMAMSIIFNTLTWFSIGAGFAFCVLSWKIIGVMSGDSKYHKSLIHSFLNTCIVSLGFSAYVRPVKQSLRIFFVFLNLYCTILLTAYQTKLITVLQNPTFENQLNNIEELVESGLKFGGTEELHDLYSNSTDTFDNVVKEKWIDVNNISSALIDVAVHRNFSVLCSRLELAHLSATMPELNDHYGNLRYFTFKTNTFSVPAEMIALRGYPFMRKFSKTLGVFRNIGINDVVRRRFASFNLRNRAKLMFTMNVQSSSSTPLSVLHLQGGFFALCAGAVSGSLVLIIEIIVSTKLFKTLLSKFQKQFKS